LILQPWLPPSFHRLINVTSVFRDVHYYTVVGGRVVALEYGPWNLSTPSKLIRNSEWP
jgi:hypothetical protein